MGSSLMTAPEKLLRREQISIGSSFEASPKRLLEEQQKIIPKFLAILPTTDPVNNMIVSHIRYSIP